MFCLQKNARNSNKFQVAHDSKDGDLKVTEKEAKQVLTSLSYSLKISFFTAVYKLLCWKFKMRIQIFIIVILNSFGVFFVVPNTCLGS